MLNKDVAIQTSYEKKAEKLRGEDGWTKILRGKAKLTQKRYGVIALGFSTAKIDFKKTKDIKEKVIT